MTLDRATLDRRVIRSDIPGHHTFLQGPSQPHYAMAAMPSGSVAPEDARQMLVGRGMSVEGDISSCDHLVIEGELISENLKARRMDIRATGKFVGTAEVENATIDGRFEGGRLIVKGCLVVKSNAHILGHVEYNAIQIEKGGRIEGQMTPLTTDTDTQDNEDASSVDSSDGENASGNVASLFADEQQDTAQGTERAGKAPTGPKVYRRAGGQ